MWGLGWVYRAKDEYGVPAMGLKGFDGCEVSGMGVNDLRWMWRA